MHHSRAKDTSSLSGTLKPHLVRIELNNPETSRIELVAAVSAWRDERFSAYRTHFEKTGNTPELIGGLSDMMDEIITTLFSLYMPTKQGAVVVATGGYGRREMFPHSDLDLLFLYRPAACAATENSVRYSLYVLWDLGFKVGHALRSIEDTMILALEDQTIRTNLLDARCVTGDGDLFTMLKERFESEIVLSAERQFVELKLQERSHRHKRFGDSRYLLEPNIKESKGGLRDVHTLYWITRYVYGVQALQGLVAAGHITQEEYTRFEKARDFLWLLRAHLHFQAGKAEERLTFDRQQQLVPIMGYGAKGDVAAVQALMKDYFNVAREVGSFTGIVCALLEEQHKCGLRWPLALRLDSLLRLEGFTLYGERLRSKNEEAFSRQPLRMLKLFEVAQKHGYSLHPQALQSISRNLHRVHDSFRKDPAAVSLFLQILLADYGPEEPLRRMNEVGLLGAFIPEFGEIVGQVQFNMYHIYTVDEHTIVALGILHQIYMGKQAEKVPLATSLMKRIHLRSVLYMALLCHDIGKAGEVDHSMSGAAIAEQVALRFGFAFEDAETVGWLVRNHLLLTQVAFKRDINDEETIQSLAFKVQTIERLRLLFVLTVADMRAVGPSIWNEWKATLLRTLYYKTENYLRSGSAEPEAANIHLLREALSSRYSDKETDDYLSLCDEQMISVLEVQSHVRVIEQIQRLKEGHLPLAHFIAHDKERDISMIYIIIPDQHGLFAKLAGAISLAGANIVGAHIFTLKDGTAVDIFTLQDKKGNAFSGKEQVARLSIQMQKCISGDVKIAKELARQRTPYAQRKDSIPVAPAVYIENDISSTHTVLEVVGPDRLGFLYTVTQALAEQGLTIGSAHISSYGIQAVDVFYLKDGFGMKINHTQKLEALKASLLQAITEFSTR